MTKKIYQYCFLLALSVGLLGCQNEEHTLRVGSKNFAESMILAEMMAQLAENEGIKVERNIPYGNTQKILEATKQDAIDLYPEYNGTALIFLGQAATSDGDASTAKVQELFKPLGLEWEGRFGFSNDYAMVMTAERAAQMGVSSISDLANAGAPVNFAVDEDFSTRAADGLGPLTRRYGIATGEVSVFPGGSEGKDKIVLSLLDGSADVAELFVTDGQIAEYNLVVLQDDQGFFPVYEPAPLVRTAALENLPGLKEVLDKLKNAISTADMQAMNKSVDLDAQTPASVATSFLVSKKILPEGSDESEVEAMHVAVDPSIGRGSDTAKALRAIRAGFPGSNISTVSSTDPLQDIVNGNARVAMVGAESFYTQGADGPESKGLAKAFAVIGYKTGHLITKQYGGAGSIRDMSKIATDAQGSGSAIVLGMLIHSLGLDDKIEVVSVADGIEAQLSGVANGDYDGVFVMASQGDRRIQSAVTENSMKVLDLNEWADGGYTAQYSFIRPATIPANTYSTQQNPVASISTQLVLASPTEKQQTAGEVGPGTAGTEAAAPLSADVVKKVNEALANGEIVDPAVPTHAALLPEIERADKSLPFAADISIINILMILFTIWVIYLIGLPSPRDFKMPK